MGAQQFEYLVRALSQEALGSGAGRLSTGRDSNRGAYASGHRKRGATGDSGSFVLAAKYREQRIDPVSDTYWFLKEVQREVRAWKQRRLEGRRVPKRLLFATNVALSDAASADGKDGVEQLLGAYVDELDLDGWLIWDEADIRALLDEHLDTRRRFLERVVTGDLRTRVRELVPPLAGKEVERLTSHAVSELISRQWVRTGDVGYGDGSKVRLADIAVDLPCTAGQPVGDVSPRFKAVAHTVARGEAMYTATANSGPLAIVLVGGPGQGKSTLAQLIAHAYRIAFLRDTNVADFGPKATEAINALRARLVEAGIPEPEKRRWPFVVELSKMGAAIARTDGKFSLLEYIAGQIVVEGLHTSPTGLLEWLRSWPVCLVLDGLDEVPDARVRNELIAAVSAFAAEASANHVDLFIVGTSRPQGYRGEFGDAVKDVELRLADLTEAEALAYSETLTRMRAADDPDLAEQVTDRLISAVHERVTQRLMTSPLQVTIMTALAEEAVELPTDRFELFDRYYKVVYDREVAKSDAFVELKALRGHIDYLHETVGHRLQERAERPAGSDPFVAKSDIRRILGSRLAAAGFEEADSDSMVEQLIRLSTERLVLLVSRRTGKYEFDVRSLQEYMAARELTTGDDDAVISRLERILPSTHWRNTWLLAAGRVLRRREHLRERVLKLVTGYDSMSPDREITRLGADLANELFLDNFGTEYPAVRRELLACAMSQFRDTAVEMPPPLRALAATVTAHADARELQIFHGALHSAAEDNLSSLAAKYLNENSAGMTPTAKQARTTLIGGRKYLKPSYPSLSVGIAHLAAWLVRENQESTAAGRLSASLGLEGAGRGWEVLPVGALDVLDDPLARALLVSAAQRTRRTEPEIAHFAAYVLRVYASGGKRQ